jgi:aminoglycoside phosphotransferase (APT) family kinase protein
MHLWNELDGRTKMIAECSGPETLLHGDPTLENVFVFSRADGIQVKFIDWDHAGVGSATFDLWTFAAEFPVAARPDICRCYFESIKDTGWPLPGHQEMRFLFETFELGRLANRLIWPALVLADGIHVEWGFDELARVEHWFDSLQSLPKLAGRAI